ncbi:type I-E CRISPR-associated protein Cse1/CasA [Geobacter pickeringii]|uniref:CRISPR-associated protein Cse1 n=1 Tax=Geobacter pickeringii TaxID=345632 RepID=A0A0B5BA43_9BACT|nr:type I-E CRISPR-associated protein Cse1/CasA [Geobacter pickeringii]AJE03588.1 hypothetical protein GPICK_09700 [Geobacter pickeringii]
MNVAFDPWIPVISATGTRELVSLCSVFSDGGEYADLAVRPHERVALMRLFLCVAHAALDGPKDYDEWCEVPKWLPEAARRYLTEWKDSFELFHPTKPWLQVAGLSKSADGTASSIHPADWTPVSKLNFSFASGNNSTLFDHGGINRNRQILLTDTVLSMLTFQCFSTGGLISQVFWNDQQTVKTARDAPCVPASMVHAFLRSSNLLDSICLNLPTHEDLKLYYPNHGIGRPVWELAPTSFADLANLENATATYVGRLVPMARLIRIHPAGERMLLGDGFQYHTFTDGFPPEPTATVVVRKDGKKDVQSLLSFRPSKALWRELAGVVVKRKAGEPGGPISLNALQEGEACDLVVVALARDQASIIDTAESVFHIPPKLATADGTEVYEQEVKSAESLASRLGWAIECYRIEVDGGWEGRLKGAGANKGELKVKLHSVATTHYWTTVERNLQSLMAHIKAIDTDNAISTRDIWRKMLFATACDAYRTACGQDTPRQMRAFAKGWQKLTLTKDEPEADNTEIREENP